MIHASGGPTLVENIDKATALRRHDVSLLTQPNPREDLLTPVHKGIRSMIYCLGAELQTADFTDPVASEVLLARMRHDLTASTQSSCIMCLLHEHAGTEEVGFYPALDQFEPDLVRRMLDQHAKIVQRLVAMAKLWDELHDTHDATLRAELGCKIVASSNEFFAYYMAHMNEEEALVVPATWKHFTDDQLRAMRGKIMASFTPHMMRTNLDWMLPALNVQELTSLAMGVKHGAPPPLLQLLKDVGRSKVDPTRWELVAQRVGL